MRRRTWMEGIFGQFLRESTIHGIKYIGSPDKHPCEKFFWAIAVLLSFGFSCFMVEEIYRKYNENPVIISFQPKETTVAQIPFPALTLCNVNILKTNLMNDVLTFLNKEWDKAERVNFTSMYKFLDSVLLSEHMTHYCLAAPSFRRLLNETLVDALGMVDYVQEIQDYISLTPYIDDLKANATYSDYLIHNISEFKTKASHLCEDMVLKCMWARKIIPCEELFKSIDTQHGSCCVFNMMPKYMLRNIPEDDPRAINEKDTIPKEEREAWENFTADDLIQIVDKVADIEFPKHQKAGGKPYGLSILINPELDMYSTCNSNDALGFKMVAHSPISYPSIMDYGVAIPPSSEVFIDIEPHLTTANQDDLMGIGIGKRNCYFPTDRRAQLKSYKFYSSTNCMDQCISGITYAKCGCVRYFMPRNSTQPLCGAKKLACAERIRKNITSAGKTGYCRRCKPACTEIDYNMQLSHFPLRENLTTFNYTLEGTNKMAKNYSIVHIFLGTDSLYAKERKRLYDSSDLLANAGGLLSLTLGFSIISFVELIYFFTIRYWYQRKDDKAAEEDEDEDFYSRSRKRENDKRKVSDVVKPRIMDGLQTQTKMNEYYNWAMTATTTASNIMNVKSSHETIAKDNLSFSNKKDAQKGKIPVFQLLGRDSTEKSLYPYVS